MVHESLLSYVPGWGLIFGKKQKNLKLANECYTLIFQSLRLFFLLFLCRRREFAAGYVQWQQPGLNQSKELMIEISMMNWRRKTGFSLLFKSPAKFNIFSFMNSRVSDFHFIQESYSDRVTKRQYTLSGSLRTQTFFRSSLFFI